MSYSILYRSMFVKLSDGRFIPMMEMGDNNVWDCKYGRGRDRRSRSWSNINLVRGKKVYSHEDLVKALDDWNNECEQKRARDLDSAEDWRIESIKNYSFGYYEGISVYGKHTGNTTFNSVKNIVLSGENMAVSFEDAVKYLNLHIVYYCKENPEDKYDFARKIINFTTEEEMYQIINEQFDGGKKKFYFCYGFFNNNKWWERRKAMRSFAKFSGKHEKFIAVCKLKDDTKRYLTIENNEFALTEDSTKARFFDKYTSNGCDFSDLVFSTFNEVKSIHFKYEREILKGIA